MSDNDEWWVSPVDGHQHGAKIGPRPDDCAVCALEAERDRLRAERDEAIAQIKWIGGSFKAENERLEEQRDRERESADNSRSRARRLEGRLANLRTENEQLRALAYLLYRTLHDGPIDGIPWLLPWARDLLRDTIANVRAVVGPDGVIDVEPLNDGTAADHEIARLRAVVDAAKAYREAKDEAPTYPMTKADLALEEIAGEYLDALYEALDELDGEAT